MMPGLVKRRVEGDLLPTTRLGQALELVRAAGFSEAEFMDVLPDMYQKYVFEGASRIELQRAHPKFPPQAVTHVIRHYRWDTLREENLRTLALEAETKFQQFIRDHRVEVAEMLQQKLTPVVEAMADELLTATQEGDSKELRSRSEALKFIADLLTKTLSIDGGAVKLNLGAPAEAVEKSNEARKTPWMSVNVLGSAQVTATDGEGEKHTIKVSAEEPLED